MWIAAKWQSANEVQFVPKFMMTHGAKYQDLVPQPELLSVFKAGDSPTEGWAFLMRTDDKRLFKLYFQKRAAHPDVSGALPNTAYKAQWFDPRTGAWSNAGNGTLMSDSQGRIVLPALPTADYDWALSLSTN
jgi:Putative collagen-binding domain of a collagenase